MIVIIAGSRGFDDPLILRQGIRESGFNITKVVSGNARGADRLGEYWAEKNHIPIERFEPDWSKGGRGGPIRNAEMADYVVAESKKLGEVGGLIAFWDGQSTGTKNMIQVATFRSLQVFVKKFSLASCGPKWDTRLNIPLEKELWKKREALKTSRS